MRPPSWLYPPPRCRSEEEDGERGGDAKRRRQQAEDMHGAEDTDETATGAAASAARSSVQGSDSGLGAGKEDRAHALDSTSVPESAAGTTAERNEHTANVWDERSGTIRGRGCTPGASRPTSNQPATIRGHLREPGTRRHEMGSSAAQQRLAARNWHLRVSLELHAERVSRKREHAQEETRRPEVEERMAALRRRVAERAEARRNGAADEAVMSSARTTSQATASPPRHTDPSAEASTTPETGACGSNRGPTETRAVAENRRDAVSKEEAIRRNELLKMHQMHVSERIHGEPAEEGRSDSSGGGEPKEEACVGELVVGQSLRSAAAGHDGGGAASSAVGAAARYAAWHSGDYNRQQSDGLG